MSPLIDLHVKLDRPLNREKPCCRNICVIKPGRGPHAGEFRCTDCGQHRGWLSKPTAAWIENVIARFGAPTTPIVVRPSSLTEEEPATTSPTTSTANRT